MATKVGTTRVTPSGKIEVYQANGTWAPATGPVGGGGAAGLGGGVLPSSTTPSNASVYRIGAGFTFLPSGNYANTSPEKVLNSISPAMQIQLANNITGLPTGYDTNPKGAYSELLSALRAAGSSGLATFMNGGWDPQQHKPGSGSGSRGANQPTVVQNIYGTPSGLSDMSAQQQYSAYTQLEMYLQAWDMPNMASWVWDHISAQGDFKNATQVLHDLRQTPEYAARFPGLVDRQNKGLPRMTEQQYLDYQLSAKQLARAYGLPQGFMNDQEIGKLVAADVSRDELEYRIKNGYEAASRATPDVKRMLHKYYGVDTNDLAAYFLNPDTTFEVLNRRLTGAKIGAAGVRSGFGQVGKKMAGQLARQVAEGTLSMADVKSGFARVAPLTPLEQAQLGQRGQATATQNQLLGTAFPGLAAPTGTTAAGNMQAVQLAEQARTAGLQGGGGFATEKSGGAGVGSATTEGGARQ